MADEKTKDLVTPKAKAMWPFITKPKTKWDPEGKYEVTLVFDPQNEEHKQFLGGLKLLTEKAATELKKKIVKPPYRRQKNENGQDTGLFEVTFKSKRAPRVFDSLGEKVTGELNMANDSVIRVCYRPHVYEGFGGGVNLYLQAVQVIEYIEYTGGTADAYGFEPEDNGFSVEAKYEQGEEESGVPATDADVDVGYMDADSDIPF